MKTYDLRKLNSLAKEFNYNRDSLEKVLRLTTFLKLFNTHEQLKGKYVLKGGTAINLCLFDLPRLSVDIDLNFNGDYSKEEMEKIRALHNKIITEEALLRGYTVSPKSRFTFSLDSYLLQYTNAVGGNDYIKLELNYSNRIQLLVPVIYKTQTTIIESLEILALNKVELYASKIAALIGRTTARDIFDVYQMNEQKMINKNEFSLLRKLTLFYLVLSNEFEPLDTLLNRARINIKNINFHHIKRNLIPMLKVGTKIDINKYKNDVLLFIDKLFVLTPQEAKFMDLYNSGKLEASLLLDDEIAAKANKHPMAKWKVKVRTNEEK
ncbi:MAG: nucleotidyl transferase AbiEii/AbiGii toxin family protein [Bacilli bacterium]|jgi:predicted nucleotidyltransferase component of viral defense system